MPAVRKIKRVNDLLQATVNETFDIPPHARAFYNDGRLFQTYNTRRASQWHLHSTYSSPYWSCTYRIHGKSLPTAVVAKAGSTVSCSRGIPTSQWVPRCISSAFLTASKLSQGCLTGSQYLRLILTSKVYEVVEETPLTHAQNLSNRLECQVLLKREDLQPVFSFKLRGAYNKMAHLDQKYRWKGVVACSAGI